MFLIWFEHLFSRYTSRNVKLGLKNKNLGKNDLKRQERKDFFYKFIYIIIVGKEVSDRLVE